MERDELERKTVGTESRSRHCGENMSNGKKSENRGNIKAKKTKAYISGEVTQSDGNKILEKWKEER